MIAELHVAPDHPAFAGHFPGLPILPGAVLLDEALAVIARNRSLDLLEWQVSSVKFLDIAAPGEPLVLDHESPNELSVRFAVRSGSRLIAAGMLTAIPAARIVDGA